MDEKFGKGDLQSFYLPLKTYDKKLTKNVLFGKPSFGKLNLYSKRRVIMEKRSFKSENFLRLGLLPAS